MTFKIGDLALTKGKDRTLVRIDQMATHRDEFGNIVDICRVYKVSVRTPSFFSNSLVVEADELEPITKTWNKGI